MSSRFIEALTGARQPVIMELKRRDAGGADLFAGRSVAELVDGFAAAGAPCLSVVTGSWFGGDRELLAEVVARSTLPVLQKDFITRTAQVRAAAELNVAAVLLTASVLPRASMHTLVSACLSFGVTPFVEVADAAELAAVPAAADCVIAVNNKDIKARERTGAGVARSLALLPEVLATGTPCPVSASGIGAPTEAALLLDRGYAGLLVGTSVLRAARPAAWLTELATLRGATAPVRADACRAR